MLPNRDLPDLTHEFFNKEGLSLALSAANPIAFDRRYYLVTHLLSSEIESLAERARDKPSFIEISRVRSGKSLFGNNLTKER